MVTVYFPYRNNSVRLSILTRILSVSLRLDSRHQCLVDRSGNILRYKAKRGGRKRKYFNGGTYISTLLTLELGNPLIGSRGVATELRPWLACIVYQTRRAKYLRNRRRKAWGHPCCPQALTRGGNEGSSRDHGGRTRGSLPEDKSIKEESEGGGLKGERGRGGRREVVRGREKPQSVHRQRLGSAARSDRAEYRFGPSRLI